MTRFSSPFAGLTVVLVAAVLRFASLDLAAYQYDEADVLLRVFDMLLGHVPLSGAMTSWGVPDPPLMVYLVSLVTWLPQPALAAAGLIALLNVVAVAVTYLAARRHFGSAVAFASGLLFAVNPWSVYFGRRFWTEILPIFTAFAFLACLEVSQRRSRPWLVVLGMALSAQIQTRLLGGLYLPAAAISVIGVAWRWPRVIVATLAASLVISAPFLIYLVQSRDSVIRALREGERGFAQSANTGLIDLVRWTISGTHLLPLESRYLSDLRWLALPVRVTEGLTTGALVAGFVLTLLLWMRRGTGWGRFPILLLWAITPIAVLAGQTSSLYLHYLVVLAPFPFLLMGLSLGWALNGGRLVIASESGSGGPPIVANVLRLVGGGVLGVIAVTQIVLTLSLYGALRIYDVRADERLAPAAQPQSSAALLAENGPRETAQALGTGEFYGIEIPLRYWLEVRSTVLRRTSELGVSEVLVLTDGTQPLSEERPALVEGMLGPQLHGRYLTPSVLAVPLDRSSLLLETWGLDPAESLTRLGERLETVPLPTSSKNARDATRFYRVPARSSTEWGALSDAPIDARLGGMHLVGARPPVRVKAGEQMQLVTYWVVDSDAVNDGDVLTVRLIDPLGQRASQRDVPLPVGFRRPGETIGVVVRHDVTTANRAPSGIYRFEVLADGQSTIAASVEVVGR